MEVIKIETSQIEKSIEKHIDNKTNIYYDIFIRNDIVKFTYYDYIHLERKKKIECCQIRDTSTKYELESSNKIHNKHDKTYRKILENKKYATYIINKALELTLPIEEKEIEKYSNRYITSEYKDKETDIVYKMKNKEIYFLVEHQNKVDYSMSFRLEEYKLEIMRSAIDEKKIKTKGYEIPTVIPIVIYTGKEKWTVRKELNKVQDKRLEELNLQQYNLIDISKYTKEELLNSNNFIDKVLLLEKIQNTDELTKILPKITKKLTKEEKSNLIRVVKVNFTERIGEENLEELIEEMKGEDEDMLGCVEMVWEEALNKGWEEGISKGRKEEKRMIIDNMLKKGISLKEIQEITKATRKEIEEVKEKIKIC